MFPSSTLEANLILDHVRQYLGQHTYAKDGSFLSFKGYVAMMLDASAIINEAQAAVNDVEAELRKLVRKVLVASIEDKNVQAMLPFQTTLKKGNTYTHIVNESFYDVQTRDHSIEQGDAICARGASFHPHAEYTITSTPYRVNIDRRKTPTCPGCLAKSKHIIVDYLLKKCDGDRRTHRAPEHRSRLSVLPQGTEDGRRHLPHTRSVQGITRGVTL